MSAARRKGSRKTVRDVFAATTKPQQSAEPQPSAPRKRGRPRVYDDPPVKVSVALRLDQVVALDRLSADIRLNTKTVVDRGELIRAMLDAGLESGIDLTSVTSGGQAKEFLLTKFKGKG